MDALFASGARRAALYGIKRCKTSLKQGGGGRDVGQYGGKVIVIGSCIARDTSKLCAF